MFTQDATYEEHAYGTFTGREEIRSWVLETMTAFPGQHHVQLPDRWHVVDASTSRVICEVRNLMPDPGDGSVHEASNLRSSPTPATACGRARRTSTTR